METILKETSVNPKVTISVEEYNRLVSLARANASQIEQRAVEYYRENGVCKIHVDAYLRGMEGACDTIKETFSFECQPRYCHILPSGEYMSTPFAIDQKTRQRISRFVAEYVSSSFRHTFGKQLMSINNALCYERQARRDWKFLRVFSFVGWLIALLLFVIAVIK